MNLTITKMSKVNTDFTGTVSSIKSEAAQHVQSIVDSKITAGSKLSVDPRVSDLFAQDASAQISLSNRNITDLSNRLAVSFETVQEFSPVIDKVCQGGGTLFSSCALLGVVADALELELPYGDIQKFSTIMDSAKDIVQKGDDMDFETLRMKFETIIDSLKANSYS